MKKNLILLFAVLLIIPTLLPLFNNGFFVVHDNTQVERVFQMTKSLSDGSLPVRLVDDLGYGYSYPIFNFYAPFAYYVGAFINLIISNSLTATKLMFGLGTAISFLSMYLFASRLTNKFGGIVAGTIYLYFPYHAANIYVRGAVGEFFAYAFLPLVFLGIYNIYKLVEDKQNFRLLFIKSIIFSVPLFIVIVSHNLTAFMLMFFIIPYTLYLLYKVKRKKQFISSIIIFFTTAFLLSSFYILPAVFESRYTNVESQIGGGAHYADHFVCPIQLWHSNWGFGGSVPGCIDGMSFSLGKINVVLIALSLLIFIFSFLKSKKKNRREIIYWILLLFSLFLTTSYSKVIWDNFYYLKFIQFPWRFLNFSSLFIAVLVAFLILKLKEKNIIILISLLIVASQIYFHLNLFKPIEINNMSNDHFENIDHIRWETSKISDEYLPPSFDKPKSREDLPVTLIESNTNSNIIITEYKTDYLEFIKVGEGGKFHINKAYYPSWKIMIDGNNSELIEEKAGMSIVIPDGHHTVVLQYKNTLIQTVGNIMTLGGAVLIIVAIIVKKKYINE